MQVNRLCNKKFIDNQIIIVD